ncbi:ABC transporter permease [Natronosporangium hydrolyticum]|uniref:ABC transporter permease n=1 Tax=Natronosporangium hydrolyticum TaxID=2811111 RepID=A0A895YB61_9ACTN|nr:ABC transporter permease [Natronosporangium hydrolyticum]QSB14987.1 ABC transporter permease [Natronosporangium hydrolyticum]
MANEHPTPSGSDPATESTPEPAGLPAQRLPPGPIGRRRAEKLDRLGELAGAPPDERGESITRETLRRLRRSPMAITGAAIVLAFVILAFIGPVIAPHPPRAFVGLDQVRPGQIPGPSAEYWFGLDQLGRDVFSRLLVGAQQTLLVGVVATLIGFTVGAIIGGVAGAANALGGRIGGWIDSVLMRFIDMLLAMPPLLLAFSVAAVIGRSLWAVMIAVGVAAVPIFARLLRASMIAQAHRDYVLAATALGVKKRRIVVSHIFPNSLAPVIVQATLTLATAIIEAAALSFLGLGNPDTGVPEWGTMLAQAQDQLAVRPSLAIYPAVAIIITALGFTLLGEAMREALDPKLRR